MSIQRNKSGVIRQWKAAGNAAGAPTTSQLAAINRYTLTPMGEDQVYVRTAWLAHNGIDRDGEVFDDALLAAFADTLPGKGLFVRHPGGRDGDSGPGAGRWFEAELVEMSLDEAREALRQPNLRFPPSTEKAKLLSASFYIPRGGKGAALVEDIDAGVAGDVSIGFIASDAVPVTDGASDQRIAMRLLAPGEAREGSLVWLGAQPGARVHKAAPRGEQGEEHDVSKEQMEALQAKVKALESAGAQHQAKASALEALLKATGATSADELLERIEDGKSYRAALVDEVLTAKRLLGAIGDTAEAVTEARKFYEGMPLQLLKSERDAAAKLLPPSDQLGHGDPNAERAAPDGKKGLRDAGVTKAALGAGVGA